MAYQKKNNTGAIFKNTKKREGHDDPDGSGDALIDGVEYWVSSWTKDKDGNPYRSLAFRRKDKQSGTTTGGTQKKADF